MQLIRSGLVSLAAVLWLWSLAYAQTQSSAGSCGSVAADVGRGGFGPFDYRFNRDKWSIVEGAHFTPQVEALVRGQSGYIGQDIAYTLNVFPNHHRALLAATRLAEREKNPRPFGMKYSIDCYFERALGFARDDNVARLIYSTHLAKTNRKKEALEQIDYAVANAGDNGFTHFNAGLLYFDLDEFEKALRQAHTAAGLGMINPTLKDRLQTASKWQEPASKSADTSRLPDTAASSAAKP